MTLTDLEVRTSQGALLALPLDDFSGGYSVQDISGLDPVKVDIVSSSSANQDGEQFHSARRDKRNIVLKLGLEPDYSTGSARKLRDNLYKFFMPKSDVALRFLHDEEPALDILGKVESFEAPLFTQTPLATMSILCFNPDFVDNTPRMFSGSSVSNLTETTLNYDGTIGTGFLFRLGVNRNITELSLNMRGADGVQRTMFLAASLLSGDVLEISTIRGSLSVEVIRVGQRVSLLYGLATYSDWLALSPGPNYTRVSIVGASMPYNISYTNKYGGI